MYDRHNLPEVRVVQEAQVVPIVLCHPGNTVSHLRGHIIRHRVGHLATYSLTERGVSFA